MPRPRSEEEDGEIISADRLQYFNVIKYTYTTWIRRLVGKRRGHKTSGDVKCRWKDNIRMYFETLRIMLINNGMVKLWVI